MGGDETQRSCGMADTRLCLVWAPAPRSVRDCTSERRMAFWGLAAAAAGGWRDREVQRRRRRDGGREGVRCIVAG